MKLPLRGPELLTEAHDVSGFDCGNEALNRFLHRHALQNLRNQSARTYVALRGETPINPDSADLVTRACAACVLAREIFVTD